MYEKIEKSKKNKRLSERNATSLKKKGTGILKKKSKGNLIVTRSLGKEYVRKKHDRNGEMMVQRLSVVNWDEAYQGGQNINNVYYRRGYSAGGNHFVPDNWINSIVIDMIGGLTRNAALPILTGLTARANPNNALQQAVPADQRAFDDFLDSCISNISNCAENRYNGAGYGDDNGQKIDKPHNPADKTKVAGYGRNFVTAITWGYGQAGKLIPNGVQIFLDKITAYGIQHP